MQYRFEPRNLEQETPIHLTKRLRYLREYNAVTQREIADALCIDRSTYAYYELGRTRPKIATLQALSSLYGVKIDDLLNKDLHEKNV